MPLTHEDIFRTYSGKTGCMCGCRGEYRDTVRAKKLMLTKLLSNEDTKVQIFEHEDDETMSCLYFDNGNRNNVAYIRAGVKLPQELLDRVEND